MVRTDSPTEEQLEAEERFREYYNLSRDLELIRSGSVELLDCLLEMEGAIKNALKISDLWIGPASHYALHNSHEYVALKAMKDSFDRVLEAVGPTEAATA